MTYPDNETVTTAYNSLMQPESLSGSSAYISDTNYDAAGRVTSRALGNGLTQSYAYYGWSEKVNSTIGQGGRLKTLSTGSLQNLAYQYDLAGNITQIFDSLAGETQVYTYDNLDRLTSWTMNNLLQESYTYNATTGNLTGKAGVTLTYTDGNHDHAVTGAGGNSYGYDSNGNQITRVVAGVTYTLGYDAENRMVSVSGGGMSASMVYDGDGKRVQSTINGVVTRFVGNFYEVSAGVVSKYYFLGGVRVAFRRGSSLYYPLGDHLGSTAVTTNTSGVKVSELRYKPFGETRFENGTTPTEYKFTGQYSNELEFGLYFYNARWYDAAIGHFAQADSIVPVSTQGVQAYCRRPDKMVE